MLNKPFPVVPSFNYRKILINGTIQKMCCLCLPIKNFIFKITIFASHKIWSLGRDLNSHAICGAPRFECGASANSATKRLEYPVRFELT